MRFTVRQYRLEDFNTLWAIDQLCFDPEIAYSRYELQVYLRRPGAFTLVADMDGQAQEPLKNAPLAWAEELEERRVWDVTLGDGLENQAASQRESP